MTNEQKAAWVTRTIQHWLESESPIDPDEASDFMCDLMHLCRLRGWDFLALANQARRNFRAETEGEKPDE